MKVSVLIKALQDYSPDDEVVIVGEGMADAEVDYVDERATEDDNTKTEVVIYLF